MPDSAPPAARALASFAVAGSLVASAAACGAADRGSGTAVSDGPSGTVTVFAAASLAAVGERWERDLETAHPDLDVRLVLDGSPGLARQLLDGARADVFVSADERTMATVTDAGLAADPRALARNRVVVAVPVENPGALADATDVSRPGVALAVCDELVPCGAAADRAFEALALEVSPVTVEPSVTAVLTRVRLGEVDAGVVYATDVLAAADEVEALPLPPAAATAGSTTYQAATLADAANPGGARAVTAHLLGPPGRAVLRDAGFEVP